MTREKLNSIRRALRRLGEADVADCEHTVEDIVDFISTLFSRKEHHKKRKEELKKILDKHDITY
jgi:transcription initiation factor IIE alpha subunit